MRVLILLSLVCALALAVYPPMSPRWGSYTWDYTDDQGDKFAGGRTYYDYVNGYLRLDAYNSSKANPGINGVTIWDMREVQPIVWTIDDQVKCYVQKVTYFNRALAEQWGDGWGGLAYVDVFSRDIVGMGNVSDVDGGSLWMNIRQWSDDKPDGNVFLLPNTIPCTKLSSSESVSTGVWKRSVNEAQGRIACAGAINVVLGKICSVGGAIACAALPFTVPFCSQLKNAACGKGSKLGAAKACKLVHKC